MPRTDRRAEAIQEMVLFFLPHCTEQSTLLELEDMTTDEKKWRYAHALFSRIRAKTNRADKSGDHLLAGQYNFEEICAKTLFNMSPHYYEPGTTGFSYPFDDDAQFWVLPFAVAFARTLGVTDPYSVSSLLRPRDAAR